MRLRFAAALLRQLANTLDAAPARVDANGMGLSVQAVAAIPRTALGKTPLVRHIPATGAAQ